MKKKMLFLSSSFPYGKGEKTFVEPELGELVREYDITLVSHADEEDRADEENESLLDESITLIHFLHKVSLFQKVKWGLLFFIDKDCLKEMEEIFHERKQLILRLYETLAFYILAMTELQRLQTLPEVKEKRKITCYSYWYTYYCYALLRLKRKNPNMTVFTRTHGVDLYQERMRGGRQPFKKRMDEEIDGVIFAAEYAREYYLEHFSCALGDNNKYSICRLGVPKATSNLPKKLNCFTIISCSYVIPLKRIELIVQALALMHEEKIRWIHIGDGEQYLQIKEYAKDKLSGKENISFAFKGYMNNSEINEFYQKEKIDCFITTSSTEGGCPVSIQEALSYGIPVIGTKVGGITEMIQENGLLVSANPTPMEIAEAIRRIYYMDMVEIEFLKANAVSTWERMFNLPFNLKELVSVIHSLEKRGKCVE